MLKILLAMIVTMSLISNASAINFDEFTMVIESLDKDVSEITYTFILSGSGNEYVNLQLVNDSEGVNVYYKDGFENPIYTKTESNLMVDVDFTNSMNRTIIVKSFVTNLVTARNGEHVITIKQDIPENVSKFEAILKLPKGVIVSDVNNKTLVFPEPTHMLSDGKRIVLDWQKGFPKESFEIFVTYETESNFYQHYVSYLYGLIITIILIVAIRVILKNNKRINKVIAVGLSKEERTVYNVIKDKKEISQKEVLQMLDYSKPRLSKLIRKLEEKELIEKKPKGRVNILKLKMV